MQNTSSGSSSQQINEASLRAWENAVLSIHSRFLSSSRYNSMPHSHKFRMAIFFNMRGGTQEMSELYRLLSMLIDDETELWIMLDKLGKYFTTRRNWNDSLHIRMVTRSANRYLNDHKSSKGLQLLAMISSHEFTHAYKRI